MTNEHQTADSKVGGFFLSLSKFIPLLCLFGLMLAIHGQALLPTRQYGFRDAAHFYYPLNQRVQMEWDAGRVPLWEPEENGGMPLLGNPTAAVFYPLKIIFFIFDYPTAAKAYIVVHQFLCWVNLWLLARGLGVSKQGRWLAATTYAFGMPILFQYCNVIFLIGAAWLPLGLLFGWRWIETRNPRHLIALAVTLSLQILGGDPQVGYMTLLCLAGLAFWEGMSDKGRKWAWRMIHPAAILFWIALLYAGTILAAQFPIPPRELKSASQITFERLFFSRHLWQLIGWGTVGLLMLNNWRRKWRQQTMPRLFFGIGLATVLGAGLSAVQLLPVMEYNSLSVRSASEGPHDVYPFSLEPYRLLEMVWPGVFGTVENDNGYWLSLLPPQNNHKQWVPSLYHGFPALLLAGAVLGFRRLDGKVKALSLLLVVSIVASMGEFTGPLWLLRRLPGMDLTSLVGSADPTEVPSYRFDGYPRDGDGGFYWLLAEIFPAFRTFRYPAKLFTFASLALALLAALAWDRLEDESVRKRLLRIGLATAGLSLVLALGMVLGRSAFESWVGNHPTGKSTIYGPVSAQSAFRTTLFGLTQTLVVSLLALTILTNRNHRRGSVVAFAVLVAVDLAVANSVHVRFVPQELFDRPSQITQLIEQAEKENPTIGGMYRVHRMPIWTPPIWNLTRSADRTRDFVEWEHNTIQPKYGITQGVQYTLTEGTTELYDFWWFFGPFYRRVPEEASKVLGVPTGSEIAYHPRRGYDLWNTRYFVTPGWPGDWKNDKRSYASFLFGTEQLYPDPALKNKPEHAAEVDRWAKEEDIQIFRNKAVYPRSWIVHEMRTYPHIEGLVRRDRESVMTEILFQHDLFWFDNGREVYDPMTLCWIDQNDQDQVRPYMTGRVRSGSNEKVTIDTYSPQRVEMTARLEKPGIVILADVFYNGWKLTVDGKPQEIIRTNRMMRGALLPSGDHKLVYTYEPESFQLGTKITAVSAICLVFLGIWCQLRPKGPRTQ